MIKWLVISSAILFVSCTKKETMSNPDALIFGYYYGFCQGPDCIITYKIENGVLYEDLSDPYAGGDHETFDFVPLPDSLFQKAKHLPGLFPDAFLSASQVMGMPDAGDWGGVYLQRIKDGQRQWWAIDMMDNNLPDWAILYRNEILAAMKSIRN